MSMVVIIGSQIESHDRRHLLLYRLFLSISRFEPMDASSLINAQGEHLE
jgi:hypothetical protein